MTKEYLDGHLSRRPVEPERISRELALQDLETQRTMHSLGAPALTLIEMSQLAPQQQQNMEITL